MSKIKNSDIKKIYSFFQVNFELETTGQKKYCNNLITNFFKLI